MSHIPIIVKILFNKKEIQMHCTEPCLLKETWPWHETSHEIQRDVVSQSNKGLPQMKSERQVYRKSKNKDLEAI